MGLSQPPDDFGRRLAAAREAVLADPADPWRAAEPFEPILEEVRYVAAARDEKLARIRALGRQLFGELGSHHGPVAMEVRHYCWHLQHLGDPESPSSSVTDMMVVTLTRFAHFDRHEAGRCSLCAEFRGDLPFQARPGGLAHLREWLQRRSGGEGG